MNWWSEILRNLVVQSIAAGGSGTSASSRILYIRDLKIQLAETGRRLWVLDITSDLGIPSFVAMSHAVENAQDFVEYGSGSHFDQRIALLRALTELNQFLSLGLMGGRDAGASSNDKRRSVLVCKTIPT